MCKGLQRCQTRKQPGHCIHFSHVMLADAQLCPSAPQPEAEAAEAQGDECQLHMAHHADAIAFARAQRVTRSGRRRVSRRLRGQVHLANALGRLMSVCYARKAMSRVAMSSDNSRLYVHKAGHLAEFRLLGSRHSV